jgi:hypothetical protein
MDLNGGVLHLVLKFIFWGSSKFIFELVINNKGRDFLIFFVAIFFIFLNSYLLL